MKEKSLYWIIGFLVYCSGVASPVTVTIAPGGSTTSTYSTSAYIIDIKITNRIYNDSLTDQQSMSYKILRREVENLFHNTYSQTPTLQYERIAEMNFSNGSVIATSTALFASEEINPNVVKNLFVTNYKRNPSVVLDLNLAFTEEQEPTHETLQQEQITPRSFSTTPTTAHSSSHFSTHSATPSSAHPSTHSPSHSSTHSSTHPSTHSPSQSSTHSSTHPSTHSPSHSSTHSSVHSSTHSPSHSSTHSSVHSSTHSSSHSSTHSSSHSTPHLSAHSLTPPSTISTSLSSRDPTSHTSPQSQNHTAIGPIHSTPSHLFDTHTTANSSSHQNVTASPEINSNKTVHPSTFTTAASNHSASNHSARPGGNVSEKPSGTGGSGTTQKPQSNAGSTATESAAQEGVPGWGVALLVLAAIILFLLLLLFILLLLCWCCWWRRRGFMNVSDPDPPGYYNPDIPMYSTHSTYDTQNGKSPQDSDFEKPHKNRTGMYVVNN